MATVVSLRELRLERTVLEKIREAWRSGVIVLPDHADQRFGESGLSDADIWNVLKHGRITKVETPTLVPRYTIRGKSVDGASVICCVELDGSELTIVTVFEEVSLR